MKNDITATDVKRLMLQSYRRYANGEISESKALKENTLLANILRAIEASATEERLRAIENALRLPHNESYEAE